MDLSPGEAQFKANHDFVPQSGACRSEESDGPVGSSSDEHLAGIYSSRYLGNQHISLGEIEEGDE
jgi:hypothetical protein